VTSDNELRLAVLRADIKQGLADVNEGRLREFDPKSIISLGRKLSAERAKSASQKKQT